MLGSAFSIARSGLAAEALRVEAATANIANASTPGYVPRTVDSVAHEDAGGVVAVVRPFTSAHLSATGPNVSIVREITTLTQAKAAYEANLAVIFAADQMTGTLLDVIGDNDPGEH